MPCPHKTTLPWRRQQGRCPRGALRRIARRLHARLGPCAAAYRLEPNDPRGPRPVRDRHQGKVELAHMLKDLDRMLQLVETVEADQPRLEAADFRLEDRGSLSEAQEPHGRGLARTQPPLELRGRSAQLFVCRLRAQGNLMRHYDRLCTREGAGGRAGGRIWGRGHSSDSSRAVQRLARQLPAITPAPAQPCASLQSATGGAAQRLAPSGPSRAFAGQAAPRSAPASRSR